MRDQEDTVKRRVTLALIVLAVACLWAASLTHRPLLAMRASLHLNPAQPLENAPPLVAFTTVALGGFRGLIADVLWIRATDLQDEAKYFEIAQLADWITELEPRLTPVWAFHAWNMAYNISVLFPEPEDRWHWVQNGVRLLRDGGIKYNAGDPLLYRELGWLYQDKIGSEWDDAHMYYRQKLVEQVRAAFDGPRPDYSALAAPGPEPGRRLRQELGMEPKVMAALDREYGPLDWRMPETHALYWAQMGVRAANGRSLECDRMTFQCMAALFRQGRPVFGPDNRLCFTLPDTVLLGQVIHAYEQAAAKYRGGGVRAAYANFLHEATMTFYAFNEKSEAVRLHAQLAKLFPEEHVGDFDGYVRRAVERRIRSMTPAEAAQDVEHVLVQKHFWAAVGERGRAEGLDRLAVELREVYLATAPEAVAKAFPGIGNLRAAAREHALSALPEPLRSRAAESPEPDDRS